MLGISIVIAIVISIVLVIYLQWLGVIPSRYPLTRFDDKEILLERRKGVNKLLSWDDITAIFPFGFTTRDICYFHNFCFELKNGEDVGFCVVDKNVSDMLTRLQDTFLDNLKGACKDAKDYDYAHPKKWIETKNKYFRLHIMLFGIAVIAITVVGIISFEGWGPYLFPIPFVFVFMALILKEWLLRCRRKCLVSLRINEDGLTWKDEFGRSQTKTLSEVKNYYLNKTKAYLEFFDGTKLMDLEKLRYWPLLREHLLSKLELIAEK